MRIFRAGTLGALLYGTGLALTSAAEPPRKPVVFKVSDCQLATTPLPTRPAKEVLSQVAGDELEAFSPVGDEEWIVSTSRIRHPFLLAAHHAFAEHRPLALSPDMIWQLLIQQAAEEVHANPEAYRTLFATHEYGRRMLSVRRDAFVLGKPDNDWPGVFAELEGMIVKNVPDSPAKDFAHAFSTSTATDIAVRQVLVLDVASDFYIYRSWTMCGIPRIELHGTVDDWRWLRAKTDELKGFNMKRRVEALKPALDELVSASEGKADPAFWKSFYKYSSESGNSYISGWINLFFVAENDELLDVVLKPKFSWASAPLQETSLGAITLPLAMGVTSCKSSGVTSVDFIWQYIDETYPMRIRAGFMGVSQDAKSLTLKPVIAWQVARVKISPEEQAAANLLSQMISINWDTERALQADVRFDPESGKIQLERGKFGNAGADSRFWCRAFPMMQQLKFIDTGKILPGRWEPDEDLAVCKAMLSAPSLTVVIVRKDIDPECLRILRSRKDWKITFPEER